MASSTKLIKHPISNGGNSESEKEHLITPPLPNELKHRNTEKSASTPKSLNLLNSPTSIPYADSTPSIVDSENYVRKSTGFVTSDKFSPSALAWKTAKQEFVRELVQKPYVDTYKPPHQKGPDYIIPSTAISTLDPTCAVALRMSDHGAASVPPISIVTLLKRTATAYPDYIALAVKRDEQWIKWNYVQYLETVKNAAKGFIKLGLEPFRGVGILGFNAPEWAFSTIAAVFAGGLSAGIYATNSPEACMHVLQDSCSNIIVVENDHQLQKILSIRAELPHLKAIIQYIGESSVPGILSWEDLLEIGKSLPDEVLERRIKGLAVNQCCTLIYTSGTTGTASGAMLSHDNIVFLSRQPNVAANQKPGEVFISYLPLSHVAAQVGDIYIVISCGGATYFAPPEALKGKMADALRSIRPHYIFGVPRIWEKIAEKVRETERQMGFFKRMMFRCARYFALKHHKTKQHDNQRGSVLFWLARKLVLDKVRKVLGLDRALLIICGGGPLSPEILDYFTSLNMLVNESYGMSESSGPNTSNHVYPVKFGSVGTPLPGIDFKIENPENGNGEICMRGRNIFMGYLNMKEKTEETLDSEGWLHTGDIGHLSESNHLYITGRIKEILITAGGENVAPVPIEDRVKKVLPIVSNCMLIGDKRKFLTILMTLKTEIDLNTLVPKNKLLPVAQDWCRSVGSKANTVEDILEGPDEDVMDAIQEGIDHVNKRAISNAQRIQKWKVLPCDFSLPGGELGPSMKLKRSYVLEKYSDIIDAFYADC